MGRVITTMAMVDVDGSSQFSANSQPKSTGLMLMQPLLSSLSKHQLKEDLARNLAIGDGVKNFVTQTSKLYLIFTSYITSYTKY